MAQLQGQDRAQYVQDMFGRIAANYDLMNRLMTFGQDGKWRKFVVKKAQISPGGCLLDIATGTGDIAFTTLDTVPGVITVGADFARPMMRVGQTRLLGEQVLWCQSDALRLSFPTNTFDAVVSGYLLRNVHDLQQCLAEQLRVVRPGGMVVALDTTPPPHNLFRPFILFYLRYIIPLMGRLVAGSSDAYTYLPESTQAFKTADDLATIMSDLGYEGVLYQKFMFGTMA
ncbi:ubiquinone/menaquinone biosynthesis methyltransferase, partial [Chloroflexota bacterium]